jgi:GR25 family glycosyltransferase involved in LPS biosynthesis
VTSTTIAVKIVIISLTCLLLARQSIATTRFPRTVVINLPRYASRREQTIKELSSKNVKFSWIDAVDGMELTQSELSEFCTPLARWFMTPGMIGCFLSHRRCWEECARSGEDLLIFEDDVILAKNFRKIVTVARKRCNETDLVGKWDVLLLGAMGCVHPHRKYGLNIVPCLVGGIKTWRKSHHVADLDLHENNKVSRRPCFIHVPMCPYGAHAYLITPKGAEKLLKVCPRASYHVDIVAWGRKELNILAIHPLIASQINSDTTIGGLVHLWKKVMPTWTGDSYTGFELGWALSGPLLRLGGDLFGGKILLTNGLALAFMLVGLAIACITKSTTVLCITCTYVFFVTALVRFLSSKRNT